jgi:hypothetical protein
LNLKCVISLFSKFAFDWGNLCRYAEDEADVLQDRPYQGSIYALPCRAHELEVEAVLPLLLKARDVVDGVETRAEENVLAVKKELVDTLAEVGLCTR